MKKARKAPKPRSEVRLRTEAEKDARYRFAQNVGLRVKWVREAADLTQDQMCKLLEVASQSAYSRWESGDNLADPFTMLRFAARMRVSFEYIYRGSLVGVHPDLAARLEADHPELQNQAMRMDWRKGMDQPASKAAKGRRDG